MMLPSGGDEQTAEGIAWLKVNRRLLAELCLLTEWCREVVDWGAE